MKSIIKMLAVFMVVAMIATPVLGEMSTVTGTANAGYLGAHVTVSGHSESGDASAGAYSDAFGNYASARLNTYAGPGEDDDSTVATAGTSATGFEAYSRARSSVDNNDEGYVSVNFDVLAFGVPAKTEAGATAIVQEDEITALGGARGSGIDVGTLLGNNVYAETDDNDADLRASMTGTAFGDEETIVSITGTGGEGWLNFDGSLYALGFDARIIGNGKAQIIED